MNRKHTTVMLAACTAAMTMMTTAGGYAAEETPETQNTILSATVASTYTLTIPAATTINFGATSTDLAGKLKVSGNVDVNQKVTVTATANALHNNTHNEDLPYTLKLDNKVFSTEDWNETELRAGLAGTGNGKELQLSVAITEDDWLSAKAGAYTGSITFSAILE